MCRFGGQIILCIGLHMLASMVIVQTLSAQLLESDPITSVPATTANRQRVQAVLPPVSHSIHQSVRGSQANPNADHEFAQLLDAIPRQLGSDVEYFGYVQQGLTLNPASPVNRTNGPVIPNYRSNAYQFNGLYLVGQKGIDTSCDQIQLGGRCDLVYGTDGAFVLSDGLDQNISSGHRFYKLGIPQIYGNLYLPIGRGVSFKFGKFPTPVGNEVTYNPNNFFYSYFLTFGLQPGNHTGILGETELTDQVHLRFGPNFGWNTSENSNHAISYAGDLRWQSIDKQTELTFAMQTGHQRSRIVTADSLVNVYSLIFKRQLTPDCHLLLEHDLLNSDSRAGVASDNFQAYSLAGYLFCDLNRCWRAGVRFEWLRDEDGFLTEFDSDQRLAPGSYYDVTFGLNWQAKPHLRIRPEIRYDSQVRDDKSLTASFDDGNSTQQWLFSCDVLCEF